MHGKVTQDFILDNVIGDIVEVEIPVFLHKPHSLKIFNYKILKCTKISTSIYLGHK